MNTILPMPALAVALLLAAAAAPAASPPPPPAEVAASGPAARHPRERPVPAPSPAVRASRDAQTPGDLRPENPVVPQISVPLRRGRNVPASERAASTAGEIDDSAARCRAATSDRERAACTRGGTVPGAAPGAAPKR